MEILSFTCNQSLFHALEREWKLFDDVKVSGYYPEGVHDYPILSRDGVTAVYEIGNGRAIILILSADSHSILNWLENFLAKNWKSCYLDRNPKISYKNL